MAENIERMKKVMKVIRSKITTRHNRWQRGETISLDEVKALSTQLDDTFETLAEQEDGEEQTYQLYANKINEILLAEEPERRRTTTVQVSEGSYSGSNGVNHHHHHEKVPIPEFDGQAQNFLPFWQIFNQTIEKTDMPKCDKFVRLITKLKGPLFTKYKQLEVSDNAYDEIVNELKSTYLDSEFQQAQIYREVEQMKNVASINNVESLHQFNCNCQSLISRATRFNISNEYINGQLTYQLWAKLPLEAQQEMAKKKVTTVKDFLESLNEIIEQQRNFQKFALLSKQAQPKRTVPPPTTHIRRVEPGRPPPAHINIANTQSSTIRPCVFCGEAHLHKNCPISVEDKIRACNTKKLCRICLRANHIARDCYIKNRQCYKCKRIGHSIHLCAENNQSPPQSNANSGNNDRRESIHINRGNNDVREPINTAEPSPAINTTATMAHVNLSQSGIAIHKTAIIKVNGEPVRMLIDEGAGCSFVSASLVKRLGLQQNQTKPLAIAVFMKHQNIINDKSVSVTLSSMDETYQLDLTPRVVESIGNASFNSVSNEVIKQMQHYGVNYFDNPNQPVEVILGVQTAQQVTEGEQIKVAGHLTAVRTKLGWVLYGQTDEGEDEHYDDQKALCTTFIININKEKEIERELEDDETDDGNKLFIQNFMKQITFNGERYVTRLPWIQPVTLRSNYVQALKRLQTTIAVVKKRGIFELYKNEMEKLESDGFAELVDHSNDSNDKVIQYMPHHGVLKADRETTKLRIVFDASAKQCGQNSLNTHLYKGSTTWCSFSSIIKFRMYRFAIIADIERAYLMVEIDERDRDALRYLWLDHNKQIKHMRMKRVPFGTAASPFLLFVTMSKLFQDCNIHPQTLQLIQHSFYVDDLATSVESEEDVNKLKIESTDILKRGGMNLRKFRTNHTIDDEWVPDGKEIVKVLGIDWNIKSDLINVHQIEFKDEVTTKRSLVSLLARIHDPIGIVLPYTVRFKFVLSEAWKDDKNWDQPLNQELQRKIRRNIEKLEQIKMIIIPRWIGVSSSEQSILHVFTDASIKAIGCVIYVAQPMKEQSSFVASKQKLVKQDTVPSLELRALQLGASLVNKLASILDISTIVLWTDSSVNIQRMNKPINELEAKVAPRVWNIKQMLNKYNVTIEHVETKNNVSDWLTKEAKFDRLQSDEWISGPSFIKTYALSQANICIGVSNQHQQTKHDEIYETILNRSTLDEMCSAVFGETESEKLIKLIQSSQRKWFSSEIQQVKAKQPVSKGSMLNAYVLMYGEDELLRVISRMSRNQAITYDQRFPVILHPECKLTSALIIDTHEFNGHCSNYRLAIIIRQRYFIVNHRKVINKTIKHCEQCCQMRGKQIDVQLAPWPAWKTDVPPHAFSYVHLDFFGPISVKTTPITKHYGLIAVCGHTHAIHLEVLGGQDAQSCIEALRRMIARRGVPIEIFSDNGSGFKRASYALRKYFENIQIASTDSQLVKRNIKWNFQTAYSPWKGGNHERHVGTVKRALEGFIFGKNCTIEQLRTWIVEVEAVVNSRPLYFSEDGEPITPSHYLSLRPVHQLPPLASKLSTNLPELTHVKVFHSRLNTFWRRWYSEYISMLKQAYQNTNKRSLPLQEGEHVIISDERRPRSDWLKGKVVQIIFSGDEYPRTAIVQIQTNNNTPTTTTVATKRLIRLPSPPPVGGAIVTDK